MKCRNFSIIVAIIFPLCNINLNTLLTTLRKLFKGESIQGRKLIAEIQFSLFVDLDPTFIYQVTMFFKKLLTANVDENKLLLSKQTNATQLEFCASQLIMYCTTKTKVACTIKMSRSFELKVLWIHPKNINGKRDVKSFWTLPDF